MMTIRQIERLWNTKAHSRLSRELLAARQEAAFAVEGAGRPCFVAALAMIRMDELSQSHLPLFDTLLRVVLAAQERDGGWGDAAVTALCVRALLLGQGWGDAVDAGLTYIGQMQRQEGVWPAGPMRRMPADPSASLFILYQLGDNERFRSAVRLSDALDWFTHNMVSLSRDCQNLWQWASLRWRNGIETPRSVQTSLFAA